MSFHGEELKRAVETVVLPEDVKARLKSDLQSRLPEAGGAEERTGWGPVPRRLFLVGMAACFVVFFGVGLWHGGLNRVWHGLWGMDEMAPVVSEPDNVISCEATGAPSQPVTSADPSGTEEPPPEPPASIILDGLSELEEMRGMAVCADEDVLQAYLDGIKGMGASCREDLAAFLELADSLPYLPLLEGEVTYLEYIPEWQIAHIVTKAANGDWVRLTYLLYVEDVPEELEAWKASDESDSFLPTPLLCAGGRVTLYRERREDVSGGTYLSWDAESDGLLVRADYFTAGPDRVVTEDLFANLTVQSLADLS